MDWEQRTAIKRSEGTFFQNLYRIKKELPGAKQAAVVKTEVCRVLSGSFLCKMLYSMLHAAATYLLVLLCEHLP